MAERRMFAKTIIDSDAFLDMPLSTQALYFHLAMRADDDGFINSTKKIMRLINASSDDLRLLFDKNYIIPFDSGVVVIKHWKIHNWIQSDRYHPTIYQEEKSFLVMNRNVYNLDTECIQDGYSLDTQDSIDKISLDKSNIDKDNNKPIRHKYGEYNNVLLSDTDMEKLKSEFPADYQERIERLSSYIASTGKKYKDFLATIRNWARNDKGVKKDESTAEVNKPFDIKDFY